MNEDRSAPKDPRPLAVGCLLAGGQSRRMGGGDKCLKDLAGRPMLAHVIGRLAPQVSRLVINANGDPARFAHFGLPVTADPVEGFVGPLGGILAGLIWARENAPQARWVATAASDTPFFPDDLVARLAAATGHRDGVIALARSGERVHPVFGLWPVSLANDLDHAVRVESLHKVLVWVSRHPNVTVTFERAGVDPFFNANTPEDFERAAEIAAGGMA